MHSRAPSVYQRYIYNGRIMITRIFSGKSFVINKKKKGKEMKMIIEDGKIV